MPPIGIIYTADSQLQSALKTDLENNINQCFQTASNLFELERCLQQNTSPAVLYLDLRTSESPSDYDYRKDVLNYLTESCPYPLKLVSVIDQFLPLDLAESASFLTDAFLEYPPEPEEVSTLARELEAIEAVKKPASLPDSRQIYANDRHVTTYTPAMLPIIDQISKIAKHNVTLLLVGETGTGKTTLASMIHELSPRNTEPFQNIACGALPSDLIESELFGHLRGSFTGAERSKIGRFEAAGKGTLLLDEIDILSAKDQAKLLKVIETGQFEPVGSTESRKSEARLIVAANVELDELTRKNKFRSDLYYRLNVLQFRLPALRERPNDIIPLSLQFIKECCEQHAVGINKVHLKVLRMLKQYQWPGNLRELKNQIQRAVLFSNHGELTTDEFSPEILQQTMSLPDKSLHSAQENKTLADQVAMNEMHLLQKSLSENGYRKTATAKALGISRVGLYKKMRKYGMLEQKKPASQNKLHAES
ncbi:sigma 54-interacting transcriptional regulator [Gimesia fumaroli]|uniref:Nif-specific regulatory protein n=1 Tax=Gimesia fumaroli TaxID=2527976 RepID=A0A518IB86_9PLAN|nr:sigma-54 dependent transcriptional regulator [Gimesia fumaroli]QDV50366.1 Nif-specific regulatory protein [Gimesia fumaroli]